MTRPFQWYHVVTLTVTFDLLQDQICCRAGDHNSLNLLVFFLGEGVIGESIPSPAKKKILDPLLPFLSTELLTEYYCIQTETCRPLRADPDGKKNFPGGGGGPNLRPSNSGYSKYFSMRLFLCPLRRRRGILLCTCPSVYRSVGMSVSLNLVQLITQERFAQGALNLVGR